jgi:hypothetical protein
MSKKILVLGLGQNNFLSFLYSKLKKQDDTFYISAPFYTEINTESQHESWMYENNKIKTKSSPLSLLISLFTCLFSQHFYQTFFFILCIEAKIGKAFHFVYEHMKAKAFFNQNKNFQNYDTFHFHFMQYSYLRELFLVPKNKKIVCTFWGSDLLRTSDILNFYFVKKALNRATVITCQSLELKEIILAKFGRQLNDKIKIAIFPVNEKIYDEIDLNDNNARAIHLFKSNYGYSLDKINILVGHNGSTSNNHLKVIQSLEKMQQKEDIHLIINLNYAITEEEKISYKKSLTETLTTLGCSFVILEKYFVNEELAISRLASDIFIHTPISDALSGTMLELLYASNIVITGSWLPYKTFKAANLTYFEINDFSELPKKLDTIIENSISEKEQASHNKLLVRDAFLGDKLVLKWSQILS